jgi:hypothetical protein
MPAPDFNHVMIHVGGTALLVVSVVGTPLILFWRSLLRESAENRKNAGTVVTLVALGLSLFVAGIVLMRVP